MDVRQTTERSNCGNTWLCQNLLPAIIKCARCVKACLCKQEVYFPVMVYRWELVVVALIKSLMNIVFKKKSQKQHQLKGTMGCCSYHKYTNLLSCTEWRNGGAICLSGCLRITNTLQGNTPLHFSQEPTDQTNQTKAQMPFCRLSNLAQHFLMHHCFWGWS